jgi:translation initiation factor IF-3
MRLYEDVKEIGQIESNPELDGRNMVMVLGPTKNAGVKHDAKAEDEERSQEAVQGDGSRKDPSPPAPSDDASGPSGEEQPREEEARAGERASRA